MSQKQNKIECPKCGEEIDVNDVLRHQIEEQLKNQYNDNLTKEKEKYETKYSQLENKVKEELKQKYKKEVEEEQSGAMNSLRDEVKDKSEKLKEFNKTKIAFERIKREKEELADSIKAEAEKELTQKLKTEKEKIRKEESDKNELKFKTLEKQFKDQKKLTEEMARKQEQGSMQTQGEVQELAIEKWLSSQFPLDTIEEIKKGERGADCLQIVNTRTHQNCGTIYYESKRTKVFSKTWIEKFKADKVEKKADIGVLVTEAMPSDMERFGPKDGILICSFEEFKGLCAILRESIIKTSSEIAIRNNKGDRMGDIYDFVTSNEFRLQFNAIVDGFTQMQKDLSSEKRAMTKIWSQREKQIDKVIFNTAGMYGSIKGIAGDAIKPVALLELSPNDEDDANA